MTQQKWLSLKKAAAQLEVHPTTLRRWADAGAIQVMVTPGGHRRFLPADLAQFSAAHRGSASDIGKQWAENALQHTRSKIVSRPNARWMQQQSAESRVSFRSLGQRLVGLAMQFLALDDEDPAVLAEAGEIGREYGELGKSSSMSLTEILRASLFFHEQLLESSLTTPDNKAMRPEATLRILQRTNKLLNTVHLGIASVYETA